MGDIISSYTHYVLLVGSAASGYAFLFVPLVGFNCIEVFFSTVRAFVATADLVRRTQVLRQVRLASVDAKTQLTDELKPNKQQCHCMPHRPGLQGTHEIRI